MDCSLAEQHQLQQQQQQQREQQQQLNSVNYLDETIRNLTNLAAGVRPSSVLSDSCVGGNNRNNSGSNNSSPIKQLAAGAPTNIATSSPQNNPVKLRKHSDRCLTSTDPKSHTYRISMANLEETQESELDVILGELSLLEAQIDATFLPPPAATTTATSTAAINSLHSNGGGGGGVGGMMMMNANHMQHNSPGSSAPPTRTHSRTNSTISGATTISMSAASETHSTASSSSGVSENGLSSASTVSISNGSSSSGGSREPRTESPDNDSAFSDTVSLLSSESSASSSVSTQGVHQKHHHHHQQQLQYLQQQGFTNNSSSKAAKIQLALHKLESASIRRLFVKAFTSDGASKSLLVDERMTCGHVTRMLADKNHVQMQPQWSLVESLGDLQMERLFEDHELLVDNLMTWNSDAGNRVLFQQRSDKVALFIKPELFLPGPQMAPGSQHDEHTRSMLLEEFFETNSTLQVDGPLYMKADSKKGWKRYHFVLRSSGLYYFPKEKTKNTRDLACLTLFNGYNVYRGIGWKKKWKAPTDFTFGFKSAVDSSLGKTCRTLKMLCAEDIQTMEKWITAIRISKYGKQLWDNQKALMEDLSMCDGMSNSSFAVSMRSESISSISSAVPSQCGSVSSAISSMSNSSSGRMSRASSSSSSGCLSDDNNGFDSEFTTGTIKRKPSMKPNLPLTSMTRQLKEVGEITNSVVGGGGDSSGTDGNSPERSGTLTRRHSRRKSQESNGSGTLKRRPQPTALAKRGGSVESMNAVNSSGSSNSTPTPTPSICAKPLMEYEMRSAIAPSAGGGVVDAMSCSTLSLDSLPPPPPPPAVHDEQEIYGSQLSLVSLPPPPPPEEVAAATGASVIDYAAHIPNSMGGVGLGVQQHQPAPPPPSAMLAQPPSHYHAAKSNGLPPAVPAKPIKPAVKPAPPYKAPPEYVPQTTQPTQSTTTTNTTTTQKKVSFADSPVLLRRKMCSPEPRSPSTPNAPTHAQLAQAQAAQAQAQAHYYALATGAVALPTTGPRVDFTRLSNASAASSGAASGSYTGIMNAVQDFGSPKRLQESTSNPPRDFLKDLQRVMRKKWQVAQKCKLEPATTPHEVLGFRDFSSEELLAHNLNNANVNNSHYYRETANVSNWVQEHYGAGAVPPPPPPPLSNEYALYENLHAGNADGSNAVNTNGSSLLMEPQFPHIQMQAQAAAAAHALAMAQARKKRPPPPPPKRSDSTHLTHRA